MVGKVEAPENANIIVPKAKRKFIFFIINLKRIQY